LGRAFLRPGQFLEEQDAPFRTQGRYDVPADHFPVEDLAADVEQLPQLREEVSLEFESAALPVRPGFRA
jgi:hypothetical protein